MHTHILIPVAIDHEAIVSRKLDLARRLLSEGGRITLLTVLEQIGGFAAEFVTVKPANHVSARILERLEAARGGAADVATKVITGKPGVEIARYAGENGVDLIVMGSLAPDAAGYMLGSTAARVIRRAHCSVHVLR